MKRQIANELQKWKDHTSRKPLIIRGPRQVGKTYIVNRFAESLVGQEILANSNNDMKAQLYYWHRETRSSNAEVDYIIIKNNSIIPVEVKSGKTGAIKSMNIFLSEHKNSDYGIRFFTGMPVKSDKLHSYPLYCAPMVLR